MKTVANTSDERIQQHSASGHSVNRTEQLPERLPKGLTLSQSEAVADAAGRIAPTWPLDQLIAVNPWWELRDRPFAEASALLSALSGARCLMPRHYYLEQWQKPVTTSHLQQATAEQGVQADEEALLKHVRQPDPSPHWHNVSDLLDSDRDRLHKMAWRDEITHQISQYCADFFQRHEIATQGHLYLDWLDVIRQDRGIAILMDEPALAAQFHHLPDSKDALVREAIDTLQIADSVLADYAHALLLDINGWASWCAYLRWQAGLEGKTVDLTSDLLAIRLGWELALWRHHQEQHPVLFQRMQYIWAHQLEALPDLIASQQESQKLTLVWQRATELAYQQQLQRSLSSSTVTDEAKATEPAPLPELQAVFCIDVRSEPMRRALEQQSPEIETKGFAGFFGLPLAYNPAGSGQLQPQLPGLLRPQLQVTDDPGSPQAAKRQLLWSRTARWKRLGEAAPTSFSLVESAGLLYAFKLLKESLTGVSGKGAVGHNHGGAEWQLSRHNDLLGADEKAQLAAGILTAMGLRENFAPRVMLVGHGSQSANNPHAAGLDCGACGGQTGEVNVSVLCQLLNDAEVRQRLQELGIDIPSQTRFIAAVHNTTTDEILCLNSQEADKTLQDWLQQASDAAREERAPALGIKQGPGAKLARLLQRRSRDWSEVRPEWGLANNACFIVAPRHRTRGLNLGGRSFLHDYSWQSDQDFSVLELIITAPMIVTNWINLQYYASVTDPVRYGSGNKVLHNVVGGHIGVFEGNGGDLRIGLPWQSVHDGQRLRHEPLRLSVYIDAPRNAITDIVSRHDNVRHLIDNQWLYLFRWSENGEVERLLNGKWQPAKLSSAQPEDLKGDGR